jgi:hypothetical protein
MERRYFLRRIGVGAAVLTVAPFTLAAIEPETLMLSVEEMDAMSWADVGNSLTFLGWDDEKMERAFIGQNDGSIKLMRLFPEAVRGMRRAEYIPDSIGVYSYLIMLFDSAGRQYGLKAVTKPVVLDKHEIYPRKFEWTGPRRYQIIQDTSEPARKIKAKLLVNEDAVDDFDRKRWFIQVTLPPNDPAFASRDLRRRDAFIHERYIAVNSNIPRRLLT